MSVDPVILQQVIETSGISFKRSATSFIFTCPKCEKKDKLYIRRKDGAFICFYCAEIDNFKGRAEYALAELLDISVKEAKSRLYGASTVVKNDLVSLSLRDFIESDELEPPKPIAMPEDFWPIDSPEAAKGMVYLNGRGISSDIATQYGLMYCRARARVIFPVTMHGNLYGYQARTVVNSEPKIITSTGLQRDRVVMFADRLDGSEHAILCEGPVDAIKAHLCGGNVATMGKIVTDAQLSILLKAGVKRIYLALDPDAAQEISLLAQRIGTAAELYHLVPATGKKDLGEMSMEAVQEQFAKAERVYPSTVFLSLKW